MNLKDARSEMFKPRVKEPRVVEKTPFAPKEKKPKKGK